MCGERQSALASSNASMMTRPSLQARRGAASTSAASSSLSLYGVLRNKAASERYEARWSKRTPISVDDQLHPFRPASLTRTPRPATSSEQYQRHASTRRKTGPRSRCGPQRKRAGDGKRPGAPNYRICNACRERATGLVPATSFGIVPNRGHGGSRCFAVTPIGPGAPGST
jgi:hypothetical protein